MTASRWFGMILLVAFLVGLYTFSHSGRFHIVDEVSLFAVTESIALRGDVDTNAIAWTQWVNSPGEVLGAFGPSGEVYSKKGPAPALLAVPLYLLLLWIARLGIDIGLLQGVLLFNVFVTALTAAMLWWCAAQLSYSDWSGATVGMAFGIATIAWPYANQFFGEPLSSLALLTALAAFVRWRRTEQPRYALMGGIGGAIAIATVNVHVVVVGILLLYAFLPSKGQNRGAATGPTLASGQRRANLLLSIGVAVVPILISGLLLFVYNQIRFGNPFDTGYHFETGEGFSTPIWQGAWGLLVSPYRGIFWHSPLMIAGLVGWRAFWRRHRREAIAILAVTLCMVGIYSRWWMWWGGFAWGPRFLVPLTPFVLLLAVTDVESIRMRYRQDRLGWPTLRARDYGLMLLCAIAVLVQIAAVVVNFVNYEIQLRSIFPTDWSDPLIFGPPATSWRDFLYSPVLGQFRLMADDFIANTDLAWVWANGTIQWMPAIIGIAVVLTTGAFFLQWWRRELLSGAATRISQPVAVMALILPIILIGVWLGEVARSPHYGQPGIGYRAAITTVCDMVDQDDALVTVAPFAYQIPMNWLGGSCAVGIPVYGYAATSMDHTETERVMADLMLDRARIWFITGGLPANDPENSVERWLSETAFKANDIWHDDYRLLQYATPKALADAPLRTLNVPMVGTQTSQVIIEGSRYPNAIPRGHILPIEIHFRLAAPTEFALRWFVQLLAEDGTPVALLDTDPYDGYRTFESLPAGEILIEKAGLQLPESMLAGEYILIAGLYNPEDVNASRLRSPDGSDFVTFGRVLVD